MILNISILLLIVVGFIWLIVGGFFAVALTTSAEQEEVSYISVLARCIKCLFVGRNIFGILTGVICCILLIPTYFYMIIFAIISYITNFAYFIWDLGESDE